MKGRVLTPDKIEQIRRQPWQAATLQVEKPFGKPQAVTLKEGGVTEEVTATGVATNCHQCVIIIPRGGGIRLALEKTMLADPQDFERLAAAAERVRAMLPA